MLDFLLDTLSWVISFFPGFFVTFVLSGLHDAATIIMFPLPHPQKLIRLFHCTQEVVSTAYT